MSYDSYKLYSNSTPTYRKQMIYDKQKQVSFLYENAIDRADNTLLNNKKFEKSPRIFDRKFVDNIHHKITVETIASGDLMECGDYLEFDNMTWLCLNSYTFHGLYCRATFMSCDWKIHWQDSNGTIKSIYVIDQNSTQYNSGESGNSTVTLGAAQHMLKMCCTEDTVLFDSPMRIIIDKNINKPTCYKVTQNDNTAYNYGKGLCCITVTETQLSVNDKLITLSDGSQVWICDYHSPAPSPEPPAPDETTDLSAVITGGNTLRCGRAKTWTVTFTDRSGNEANDCDFRWNIVNDHNITQNINGQKIQLKVDDEQLIDCSFILSVMIGDTVVADTTISVVDGF